MSRSRAWCFTRHNYDQSVIDKFKAQEFDYLILGKEVCPTTGRPHLQGYLYVENKISFKTLQRLDERAHFEMCRSTVQANYDYCTKSGDFEEYGTKPKQGKRTDLDAVRESIDEGDNLRTCLKKLQSPGATKFMQLYMEYHEPKRNWKTEVFWFFGPTGVGKTTRPLEAYPEDEIYFFCQADGTWWNQYDAHPYVVMDDIRPDTFRFSYLLQLLDRFPVQVKVKGSMRSFLAKKLYITSPFPPEKFVPPDEDGLQLYRRIDHLVEISSIDQKVEL